MITKKSKKRTKSDKEWGEGEKRSMLPVKKPAKRSTALIGVREKIENRLENNLDELTEAMEGLATLASDGKLPAGISRDDIERFHSNLMLTPDELDNPDALTKAMNQISPISTRWGIISVKLEYAVSEIKMEHDRWVAEAKLNIEDALFQKARNDGSTANNAKPNKETVQSQFLVSYMDEAAYRERLNLLNDMSQCRDYVKVIMKGLETLEDMLTNIGHMQRMMIDKGIIIHKKRSK